MNGRPAAAGCVDGEGGLGRGVAFTRGARLHVIRLRCKGLHPISSAHSPHTRPAAAAAARGGARRRAHLCQQKVGVDAVGDEERAAAGAAALRPEVCRDAAEAEGVAARRHKGVLYELNADRALRVFRRERRRRRHGAGGAGVAARGGWRAVSVLEGRGGGEGGRDDAMSLCAPRRGLPPELVRNWESERRCATQQHRSAWQRAHTTRSARRAVAVVDKRGVRARYCRRQAHPSI